MCEIDQKQIDNIKAKKAAELLGKYESLDSDVQEQVKDALTKISDDYYYLIIKSYFFENKKYKDIEQFIYVHRATMYRNRRKLLIRLYDNMGEYFQTNK